MRIFCRQTNLLYTDPVIDTRTKLPVTGLTIEIKIYDSDDVLVPSSDITLTDVGGGVYEGIEPLLATVDKTIYKLEIKVLFGSTPVWYFKGPIKAIIRDKIDV